MFNFSWTFSTEWPFYDWDCSLSTMIAYDLSFLFITNFIVCFPLSQIHAFLKRYLPVGLMHLVLAAYADPVVFTNVRKLRVPSQLGGKTGHLTRPQWAAICIHNLRKALGDKRTGTPEFKNGGIIPTVRVAMELWSIWAAQPRWMGSRKCDTVCATLLGCRGGLQPWDGPPRMPVFQLLGQLNLRWWSMTR